MPNLNCNIGGIKSPNPFWLASGPPTNTAYQVRNAFDAGWGGAVWKTLTDEPIVNVASRYGGIALNNQKLMGLNNIELITDRSLEDNLREIAEVKRKHPEQCRDRLGDGRIQARDMAPHHPAHPGCRRGRL